MSTFSKILYEKLKKEEIPVEETYESSFDQQVAHNGLGIDLLKWLNSSPLSQKSYYKVDDSSYSIYKKDPKMLEKQKKEREEREFSLFLSRFSTESQREAVRFLYSKGARSFMNMTLTSLKRDYKQLALKLHPDRHFNEIPSVQKGYEEDFRRLTECFETLKTLISPLK